MSDYTKSTNFASKDSLSVGNPLKIVKGTEIDTEFNNIATAVATKADIANPTFTGAPAAPTASAGTNTTQLATTAFVATAVTAAVTAYDTALTVSTTQIENDAVTSDKIATGAVGNTELATDAVTQDKLANNAVGTAEIIDANITPAKLSGAQSGSAPIYGARAWVNFNGISLSGTYGRTGTTVTISMTSHGMTTGQIANLTFSAGTGGTATSGNYSVTVIDANSFTITDTSSGTISGSPSVTRNIHIRASGNVSTVTDNGVGDYTINFTVAMPDANFAVSVSNWNSSGFKYVYGAKTGFSSSFTASSVRIIGGVVDSNFNTAADSDSLTVVIYR